MNGFSTLVFGIPAPQGSKRVFIHPATKRPVLTEASSKTRPWRQKIVDACGTVPNHGPLEGPVAVYLVFTMPRPKSAPKSVTRPATRPDCDKLQRAVFDSLTDAGVWKDDAQVCEVARVAKVFPCSDAYSLDTPGLLVAAVEMSDDWKNDLRIELYKLRVALLRRKGTE
jgi:crossover junction endodeoxyribonuclease RusA